MTSSESELPLAVPSDALGAFLDKARTLLGPSTTANEENRHTVYLQTAKLAHENGIAPMATICTQAAQLLESEKSFTPLQEALFQSCREWCHSYLQLLMLQQDGLTIPDDFQTSLHHQYHWLQRHPASLITPSEQANGERTQVLIADDDEMIRDFLLDLLEESNADFHQAANGEVAIELIQSNSFDIIFTDIKMPLADGIRVLQAAKLQHADTEVVLMTGFATLENATEAIHHGAYDYLKKPFLNPQEIVVLFERLEQSIRLKRENRDLLLELQLRNEDLERSLTSLSEALTVIQEKQRALIQADRMVSLGTLTAGVAHEINNPVTYIRGHAQTLEKSWETLQPWLEQQRLPDTDVPPALAFACEEYPQILTGILDGTERIQRIVNGLKSFAHPEAEEDNRTSITLRECITTVFELLGKEPLADIDVSCHFAENAPPLLLNCQQIEQVLINLILNASQALAGIEGPHLTLTCTFTEEGQSLEIRDNGCGMDDETQDKIFTPFFTTKAVNEGTGLGLSIAQGIMKEHGGQIFVESSVGKGTAFTLTLPATPTADQPLSPCTILIADDEPNTRILAQEILLKALGCRVEGASGGTDALQQIPLLQPDVLLLDIRMADMSGFEVLKALATHPPHKMPVILAFTGVTDRDSLDRLESAGVHGVITKPFATDELIEAVRKALPKKTCWYQHE
ncbi:MAG: hybrid sensor histidine kinase/response regulator [Planctomycetota bacterium]|jgi:signal transduction histidine kinase